MKKPTVPKDFKNKIYDQKIVLTVLEDFPFTKIITDDTGEKREVIYKVKRNIRSKMLVPIYDIGTRKQLLNSKGVHYKDRFLVNINKVGDVVALGNFYEFENLIQPNFRNVIVKGFKQ